MDLSTENIYRDIHVHIHTYKQYCMQCVQWNVPWNHLDLLSHILWDCFPVLRLGGASEARVVIMNDMDKFKRHQNSTKHENV